MSWDIFVQYIPEDVKSIKDMPADYSPRLIGTRSEIIAAIREILPSANFSDPEWGVIDGTDFSLEVNLGTEEQVQSFAFHVRGGDLAVGVIADILLKLNLRAFDGDSETGIFEPKQSVESLRRWREYRNKILNIPKPTNS